MIVWGWRTVFRVVGSGVFSCPSCGADRNYERRRAQRFFTLFFIPLIPLKVIGEFIRCTTCRNDFRESVLARPTAAQFTDLLQNTVRGVMVNVLRRGGAGHPAALAIAVEEIVACGAVGYSQTDLAQDLRVVPDDLTQLLAGLAGQLPEAGREALVRGAVRVAAADGPVDVQERAVIDGVGAALGMTRTHVAGVVASVPNAEFRTDGTGPHSATVPNNPTGQHGTGQRATVQHGTGQYGAVQDAVPPGFDPDTTRLDPSSAMETMVIPPRPAPAQPPAHQVHQETLVHESSSMDTMMLPPKPAAPTAPAPTAPAPAAPAPAAPAPAAPAPTAPAPAAPESKNEAADGSGSGYHDPATIAIAAPVDPVPAPAPAVATPVAPVPGPLTDSSAMETMVVPINQVPPPRPVDPGDEPTHVTERPRPEPGAWPPLQQEE